MSEAIREPRVDRTGWPPGPWSDEPNRWEDRHAGFPVLAVRNYHGAWCGYVGVPPGHPWHGRHYETVDAEAHGGLTYSDACNGLICHLPREGEPAEVWWLGFDCSHAGDLSPADLAGERKRIRDEVAKLYGACARDEVYRTLAFAQQGARELADQAAAAR